MVAGRRMQAWVEETYQRAHKVLALSLVGLDEA
jgi:hypothetical protein